MSNNSNYESWKNWDLNSFGKMSKFEKAYFDNITKLLRLKESSKILEIGFGNGSFMSYAYGRKFNYDGVEENENLVNFALEKNFSAFNSIDSIRNKSKYDLIALFDVIEHIPEDEIESFLKMLSIYLEDSGSIFMRFPNGSSPFGLDNQHSDITHCSIVTLSKLNYWCSNSNLKVKASRGCVEPFIFKHDYLKMPSRLVKLILYRIFEKLVRLIFIQSKGILSANLEVVIQKNNES
jgi:2-polyprenyl-3-methyl-5-hydroxy-6-metoxy-1,4-benzoquinol methylase